MFHPHLSSFLFFKVMVNYYYFLGNLQIAYAGRDRGPLCRILDFLFLCPCRFIDLFSRVKEDKSGDLYGPREYSTAK